MLATCTGCPVSVRSGMIVPWPMPHMFSAREICNTSSRRWASSRMREPFAAAWLAM